MAKLIRIENLTHPGDKYCKELEEGNILFFSKPPFDFPQAELDFLLAQKQTGSGNRKNIAYKPQSNKITNFVKDSDAQEAELLRIMRNYSQRVTTFLTYFLAPYATKWKLDYASFRPFQEKGRKLRVRARNDLLHIDSFPSRPMHGSRILRFFTNINPTDKRHWTTTEGFADLAKRFGGQAVPFPKKKNPLTSLSMKLGKKAGLPIVLRSPYDLFMLNLHNYLKENEDFQKTCPKDYWEFPPNSCWAVFTDQVSHAATAGQYAIEQTIIVPKNALVQPEKSPIEVLERLAGHSMVEPVFC